MRDIMSSMSQGRVGPLFDAMAEDVTWRWMGVTHGPGRLKASSWSWGSCSEERGKGSPRRPASRCIAFTVTVTSWW